MTLQQLEYILAVDRFRHFAKAAEFCCVTQPTLSAMIQKLEEELGAKIFDRSRQPVRPTSIGLKIIGHARHMIAQAESLKGIVKEEMHSLAGTFRLGILPTIAPYLLPRFFPVLMNRYPEVDIQVAEMKTAEIKKSLQTGEINAGIVADLSDLGDFVRTELFYEQFYVYVSRESKLFGCDVVRTSDLEGENLWLLDEGHCFRDQLLRFCQMKSAQASQMAYRLGSLETFMRMVEGGRGVTFIPELAVLQLGDVQRQLVKPFAIPSPARRIVMLTSKDYVRLAVVEAVSGEIRASVPKDMLSLRPGRQLV